VKFLRRFFIRISNFATGRRADQRLQEEMAEHLALQTEENLRAGMSPAEARRQAALKLGAAQAIREQHHAEQGLPLAENFLVDLRYAFRMLHRSPGFSLIAIATMALGVGATTAIYSVIDATLLHPLPYPHPSELVRIEANLPGVGAHDVGISIPELRDLQNSGIFQYVSFCFLAPKMLPAAPSPRTSPERRSHRATSRCSASTQRWAAPSIRTTPAPGSNGEVVISDGLWKRAFGADPHILGKSLRLDNDLFHIVGVMPASFRDQGQTAEERNTELWASDGFYGDDAPPPMRGTRFPYETIARLQPGLSPEAAQGRLDALVASLKKQYPADYPPQAEWTIHVTPLAETLVGNVRQSLILLFGAVGLVLLISSVNVANLLLARASARGREMAVRQALGAARMRLVRQLLTESLLLFVLGGITGFAVLFCARKFLLQFIPESLPRLNDISISWGVLAFAIVVSVAAGTIFGLAPAWLTSRLNLTTTLRQEGRGSNGSRRARACAMFW
jgi:predicted permease